MHEVVSPEGDKDGNEVPLGKMIKRLKSQGNKARNGKKNKSSAAQAGSAEMDVDVLKMVREINLDNLGKSSKFESTNGHEEFPHKKEKLDPKFEKGEKRKASYDTAVPVPKKRRSSAHGISRTPSSSPMISSKDAGKDLLQVRLYSLTLCLHGS